VEESICTDSDGGINYYEKGVASGVMHDGTARNGVKDHCSRQGDKIQLAEWGCFDEQLQIYYYDCPNGCEDGVCVSLAQDYCGDGVCVNTEFFVSEGEVLSVLAGGIIYEVDIEFLSGDFVKLNVSGEITSAISVGETYMLDSGFYLGVYEILYSSKGVGSKVSLFINEKHCPEDCSRIQGGQGYCGDGVCVDNKIFLSESEFVVVETGSETYNIRISSIDSSRVNFIIKNKNNGGTVSIGAKKGEDVGLRSGLSFRIEDILFSSKYSGASKVELIIKEDENSCPQDCKLVKEKEIISMDVKKGWNLFAGFIDPVKQVVGGDISKKNIKVIYALTSYNQEWARVWPNPENRKLDKWLDLGASSEGELLSNGFLFHSDKDGVLEYELIEELVYFDERQIFEGWNFVGITEEMEGFEGRELVGDCDFTHSFVFDNVNQKWESFGLSDDIDIGARYNVWSIRVEKDCNLGRVEVPDVKKRVFPGVFKGINASG